VIKRIASILFALMALALSTGCAVNRATATLMPDADLSKVKTVYVVKHDKDDRGVGDLIKTNLVGRGYHAEMGPEVKPPYKADAVVTYVDKWMWDITMYLLELTITVRDKNDFPLATGNSLHTSLTRKSPPEMVDEVVNNILTAKPTPAAAK
jgi:hypothetical protein